jgi:hypothetical protein
MATSFPDGTQLQEVLSGDPAASVTVGAGGTATISLAARGVKILVPSSDVIALP